jgi:hypothetical protein
MRHNSAANRLARPRAGGTHAAGHPPMPTTHVAKRYATAVAIARRLGWPVHDQGTTVRIEMPQDWAAQVTDLGRTNARFLHIFHQGLQHEDGQAT